jgi:hypothetical protein
MMMKRKKKKKKNKNQEEEPILMEHNIIKVRWHLKERKERI